MFTALGHRERATSGNRPARSRLSVIGASGYGRRRPQRFRPGSPPLQRWLDGPVCMPSGADTGAASPVRAHSSWKLTRRRRASTTSVARGSRSGLLGKQGRRPVSARATA
jgi:hypothetical protein